MARVPAETDAPVERLRSARVIRAGHALVQNRHQGRYDLGLVSTRGTGYQRPSLNSASPPDHSTTTAVSAGIRPRNRTAGRTWDPGRPRECSGGATLHSTVDRRGTLTRARCGKSLLRGVSISWREVYFQTDVATQRGFLVSGYRLMSTSSCPPSRRA
jgi:hypothetical protein